MDIEENYELVRQLIDAQDRFGQDINSRLSIRLLIRLFCQSNWDILRIYPMMFTSYCNDRTSFIDKPLLDLIRNTYEELTPPEDRNEEAYAVYISTNNTFALARRILKNLPKTDFDGLLAMHDFRKSEIPILKEKKLIASAVAAIFAIIQKSDIKLFEGFIIKLPYADIPVAVQHSIWAFIAVLALGFFGYYFFMFRKRAAVQRRVREILSAGKILADSKLRQGQ